MSPHRTLSIDDERPTRQWLMGRVAFEDRLPHHDGLDALWDTKWKQPCQLGLFPFNDGKYRDFEAVMQNLIEADTYGGSLEYTFAFMAPGTELSNRAQTAQADGDCALARDLYHRSAALFRVARLPHIPTFPNVTCSVKHHAWDLQKDAYLQAGQLWEDPLHEVNVPHIHRMADEGDKIPIFVRTPASACRESPVPVVILLSGLDTYRTDHTHRLKEIHMRGWAAITVDVPGVGDCPANPCDPDSADRLWDSLMDWMKDEGQFDMTAVVVWGAGIGGFYSVRIAHTHKDRILGAVAHGAGCHNFLDRDWLEQADNHDYHFGYNESMAAKFGYKSVLDFQLQAQQKFSLLKTGILDGESAPLLFINGGRDGIMPVEDSMMIIDRGAPREGRIFPSDYHMGPLGSDRSVYPWMDNIVAWRDVDVDALRLDVAAAQSHFEASADPTPIRPHM
ncbi:Alpha/Beta hydrolase protein [Stachybotrys elegans]|uniref:Alpha/Beta hydrolase protein n=1 Tax=Stachybotrys elegans TaxID=80388 RepID=A0A8K0SIM6_9HYPO|nr:Alpha/Beta hydrolase protein [Stachybotrys elegans]